MENPEDRVRNLFLLAFSKLVKECLSDVYSQDCKGCQDLSPNPLDHDVCIDFVGEWPALAVSLYYDSAAGLVMEHHSDEVVEQFEQLLYESNIPNKDTAQLDSPFDHVLDDAWQKVAIGYILDDMELEGFEDEDEEEHDQAGLEFWFNG